MGKQAKCKASRGRTRLPSFAQHRIDEPSPVKWTKYAWNKIKMYQRNHLIWIELNLGCIYVFLLTKNETRRVWAIGQIAWTTNWWLDVADRHHGSIFVIWCVHLSMVLRSLRLICLDFTEQMLKNLFCFDKRDYDSPWTPYTIFITRWQ